jgi:hypothetical protein
MNFKGVYMGKFSYKINQFLISHQVDYKPHYGWKVVFREEFKLFGFIPYYKTAKPIKIINHLTHWPEICTLFWVGDKRSSCIAFAKKFNSLNDVEKYNESVRLEEKRIRKEKYDIQMSKYYRGQAKKPNLYSQGTLNW